MKKFILCFLMLLGTGGLLKADSITFQSTVNSARISMDEAMQLTLTFTGVNQDLDPISLPNVDGFTAKYVGPSTSVSFVNVNGNSETHSERSFIYNLFPNKVGKFEIPAVTATINGQVYTTKPIEVEVFQSSDQAQAAAAAADQNPAPSMESLKDKILVEALVDKKEVYLNERVPLTIKLLVNDVPIRDIQYPQFDRTGIAVDDYEQPKQGSEVINGLKYDTVEFKTNVYPDHLGDLNLGPVQIQGNVLYKTGQQNPFSQDNDFFGGNVFNNFFDSYATRPVTLQSQAIQLHVSPLPEENRPWDFSGAIGQFDFHASVSPSEVKAGDPLTLKMEVKGNGNFKGLKIPVFKDPEFKTYEPKIKNTGDEKTAEEVIIPITVGTKEVPALTFSYFDTSIKGYKTITQGPFAIKVTAPSADQDFKAVGFADVSKEPAVLPANPFSLAKIFNNFCRFLKVLGKSIWFWISLGLIFVGEVLYFSWSRFQYRLENDPAFARKLKAVREARKALVPAEKLVTEGKTKDLYALLSKTLHDYLANKWHQYSTALSTEEIVNRLKAAKVDDIHIGQVRSILEQADLVCFAGATVDPQKMHADLSKVQELITHFEKFLR